MNPQLSFFNTNDLKSTELVKAEMTARKQEEIVHAIFLKYRRLTASDCWTIFSKEYVPEPLLTSCRRAITNLCNKGKLVKTFDKKKGLFGASEYYYVCL